MRGNFLNLCPLFASDLTKYLINLRKFPRVDANRKEFQEFFWALEKKLKTPGVFKELCSTRAVRALLQITTTIEIGYLLETRHSFETKH